MGKPESRVENRLRDKAKKMGCLCLKFMPCGHNGVPDRIFIGFGHTVFVELKAPSQKPRANQIAMHDTLRDKGVDVRVIDTINGVDAFLEEMQATARLPSQPVDIPFTPSSKDGTRESVVESHLYDETKRLGGLCFKFTPCGVNGVPDRIVVMNGRIVFVELKAPGKMPRPNQFAIHRKMRRAGAIVHVIDSKHGVDELLASLS